MDALQPTEWGRRPHTAREVGTPTYHGDHALSAGAGASGLQTPEGVPSAGATRVDGMCPRPAAVRAQALSVCRTATQRCNPPPPPPRYRYTRYRTIHHGVMPNPLRYRGLVPTPSPPPPVTHCPLPTYTLPPTQPQRCLPGMDAMVTRLSWWWGGDDEMTSTNPFVPLMVKGRFFFLAPKPLKSPRREVVRSSAGAGAICPPRLGVIWRSLPQCVVSDV